MLLESICFVWTIISGIEIFLIGVTVKYIYIYIYIYIFCQNHLSDEETIQFKLTKHFLFKIKLSL